MVVMTLMAVLVYGSGSCNVIRIRVDYVTELLYSTCSDSTNEKP